MDKMVEEAYRYVKRFYDDYHQNGVIHLAGPEVPTLVKHLKINIALGYHRQTRWPPGDALTYPAENLKYLLELYEATSQNPSDESSYNSLLIETLNNKEQTMQPSNKTPAMNEFLDKVSKETFGRSRIESIENNICVDCGGPAAEFKDQLSRKEYTISGLCQSCQDKIWG